MHVLMWDAQTLFPYMMHVGKIRILHTGQNRDAYEYNNMNARYLIKTLYKRNLKYKIQKFFTQKFEISELRVIQMMHGT